MSPEHLPNTSPEYEAPQTGKDLADTLIDQHVEQSGSIGEVRSAVLTVLTDVEGDREAIERVEEYQASFLEVASGHDAVELKKMSGGLQGYNQVGTHNSTVNAALLSAHQLIEDTKVTDEVLDHEDSEESGHAGQLANREGLVTKEGTTVEGTELYEGEVESQQAVDKRGSAGSARGGQPTENYGSGQQKVAPNLSVFSDYLRKGTDRIQAQADLLRGQSREQIITILQESGQYSQEDILKIVATAA